MGACKDDVKCTKVANRSLGQYTLCWVTCRLRVEALDPVFPLLPSVAGGQPSRRIPSGWIESQRGNANVF